VLRNVPLIVPLVNTAFGGGAAQLCYCTHFKRADSCHLNRHPRPL